MLRSLSMLMILLLAAGTAGAADIPQAALETEYMECMRSVDISADKARWTKYCACALQGVQEQFDREEYIALFQAMQAHQPGAPGSVAKLEKITSACEAETLD